jgi:hypothetical protein
MRILPAFLLSFLALLAGCANLPGLSSGATSSPSCEQATVPAGAVFGVREGMDIATYPPQVTRGMTGCQRVWHGERARPDNMQVLATYYFQGGEVRRLVGRVPGGVTYDCKYRDGALDVSGSQNPGQCPKTSEFDRR